MYYKYVLVYYSLETKIRIVTSRGALAYTLGTAGLNNDYHKINEYYCKFYLSIGKSVEFVCNHK